MNVRNTINKVPLLRYLPGPHKIKRLVLEWYKDRHLRYLMTHKPQQYADYLYKLAFGHGIDWEHPRDLNEWINYLAFKTDTSEWTRLADKYGVRQFVEERGLGHILLPLYGKWECPEDIDFDALPQSFVMKTNCSCGDTIIVGDKSKADYDAIRQKMRRALEGRDELFVQSAEPHYLKIRQFIVCEQLIPHPCTTDYKVWCFHGEPFGVLTCSNRNKETHHLDLAMYDLCWNRHDEWMTEQYRNDVNVPRPLHFDEMIGYARILSKGFPEVRVDFYDTPKQVCFGEMTFTSYCGRMPYYTKETLLKMGNKVAADFNG